LPDLVNIKKKYKYRLILDESLSFGTLGSRCCGVTNLFDVPSTEIDIIAGSLSNSLGSAGGFCAGDKNIVDHQVLSSQAYCYSASLPAFLAAAAVVNLQTLSSSGNEISHSLSENTKTLRKEFTPYPAHMELLGSNNSPLLYLAFNENYDCDHSKQRSILNLIVKDMKDNNKVLLTLFTSVEKDEKIKHRPMIKIAVSAGFGTEQVRSFSAQLRKSANKFIKN
jgi:serine palmitoyltransferase